MFNRLFLLTFLTLFHIFPTHGLAQGLLCAPFEQLRQRLSEVYKEEPMVFGITRGTSVMRLFVNPQGERNWTIVITYPTHDKHSCLIAAGTALEFDSEWGSSKKETGAPTGG